MALTLHLAALVGFAVSGFADGNLRTRTHAVAPTVRQPMACGPFHDRPSVVTCRRQRDGASGRLSALWKT